MANPGCLKSGSSEEGTGMAQGFVGRLSNLWRGFLSLWISDVERNNPEIAYENAINSMLEKYTALKRATAAIIGRREELEQRHGAQARELAQVNQDLNVAVATNQDDLALVLIQKKNQLETQVAELELEMKAAMQDSDSAKSSLVQIRANQKAQGRKRHHAGQAEISRSSHPHPRPA